MPTNKKQKKLLSFMDIDRMAELFDERPDIMEFVAKIILQNDTLRVESFELCKFHSDSEGRSLSMLLNASDEGFNRFVINIFKCDMEVIPIKARFHLSKLILQNCGDDPQKLDSLQIRFISIADNDIFGASEPLYHAVWRSVDCTLPVDYEDDQIIYVNGAYKGDDDIGKLIHDLNCTAADDMHFPIIADRAKELSK